MKKSLIYLSVVLLTTVLCGNICAQKYSKVKITLKNGTYLEGKKGVLSHDKINFFLADTPKDYALQDVSMIMGKKNRIGAYTAGFGGGCFVIAMIAVLANPNDADQGQLFAGALIWTGIFAGIGAGIGALASKWKTIYVGGQHTAFLDRVNLSFSSHREAPYNIGLVYKLKH